MGNLMHCMQISKILLEYLIEILNIKKCSNVDSKTPLIINSLEENVTENNMCMRMYITVLFEVVKNEAKSR